VPAHKYGVLTPLFGTDAFRADAKAKLFYGFYSLMIGLAILRQSFTGASAANEGSPKSLWLRSTMIWSLAVGGL